MKNKKHCIKAVSYTHLDVYKRQAFMRTRSYFDNAIFGLRYEYVVNIAHNFM